VEKECNLSHIISLIRNNMHSFHAPSLIKLSTKGLKNAQNNKIYESFLDLKYCSIVVDDPKS